MLISPRTTSSLLVAAALALTGCDLFKKATDKKVENKRTPAAGAPGGATPNAAASAAADARATLSFTADYPVKPVNLLIIYEKCGSGYNDYYGSQLIKRLQYGMKVLGARIAFTSLDMSVGFLDIYSADGEIANVLKPDTPDIANVAAKTGAPDCPAQNSQPTNPAAPTELLPMTLLKKALARAETPGDPNALVFAKGAFVSILYLENSQEGRDPTLPDEVSGLLDRKLGAGNWSVSAITGTPDDDKNGCTQTDNSDYQFGLQDAPPPGTSGSDDSNTARFVTKLQERSKGLFLSRCELSYARFFQKFLQDSSDTSTFQVDLGQKVMWDNLDVKVGDAVVNGWRYTVGDTKLTVPRTLPVGTKFDVKYEAENASRPNVAVDPVDASEKPLTPEEKEFNGSINQSLAYYCGNCHGQNGPQRRFVDRFFTVKSSKAVILDRIQKPDGDAQKMPPTALPAEDKDKIVAFLNKL